MVMSMNKKNEETNRNYLSNVKVECQTDKSKQAGVN